MWLNLYPTFHLSEPEKNKQGGKLQTALFLKKTEVWLILMEKFMFAYKDKHIHQNICATMEGLSLFKITSYKTFFHNNKCEPIINVNK